MSRRIEIIRRAAEVFERKGVNHTSMGDIASAVGVKREAIYYYFKSRREILLEIILPQSKTLLTNIRRIINAETSSVDKLHEAIASHLNQYDPSYLEMTIAVREDHFYRDDSKLSELRQTWDAYTDCWIELIEEGQKKGEFRRNLDPQVISYGILGMCNWLSRWYDPSKEIKIPDIIDMYFTVSAYGLSADPDETEGRHNDPSHDHSA